MGRIALLVSACLFTICLQNVYAADPMSPLFQARLDATTADWERDGEAKDSGNQHTASPPAGANPQSLCTNTQCIGSTCIGSACLGSMCTASNCIGSICGGSACYGVSVCPKKCTGNDGASRRESPDRGNVTVTWGQCRRR